MSRVNNSIILSALMAVCMQFTASTATSQPQQKLEEAKAVLEKAKSEEAEILSPDTYRRAEKSYQEAVKKTKKGESLDKIRKLIEEAIELANTSIRNTELARVTFVDVLPARQKALEAKAPALSSVAWKEAAENFYDAASALEKGDASKAKKKAAESRDLFLDAELLAIKESVTGETRRLIDELDAEDIGKFAFETI